MRRNNFTLRWWSSIGKQSCSVNLTNGYVYGDCDISCVSERPALLFEVYEGDVYGKVDE